MRTMISAVLAGLLLTASASAQETDRLAAMLEDLRDGTIDAGDVTKKLKGAVNPHKKRTVKFFKELGTVITIEYLADVRRGEYVGEIFLVRFEEIDKLWEMARNKDGNIRTIRYW